MNLLKKIALVILVIPILVLLAAFLPPTKYRVTRTVAMKAPPDVIFSQINTLKTWPEWTAWTKVRYPDMQISFSGPESGVGATYSWDGRSTGQGVLTITKSDPGKGIGYDLAFDQGKFKSTGAITIEPAADQFNVTWLNEGHLGSNPINRYLGLMKHKMMGPDFDVGLRNLKQRVEAPPK